MVCGRKILTGMHGHTATIEHMMMRKDGDPCYCGRRGTPVSGGIFEAYMKWINHEVVTGVIVYAATDDLLLTIYSMAGAIVPDKLEGMPGNADYWSWRSRHRGWSHWPVLYALLYGLIAWNEGNPDAAFRFGELAQIGQYFCIGALLHIAEDALCGKVPFLLPSRKVGVKLFKVGSFTEYFVCIAIVAVCYGLKVNGWIF